MFGQHWIWIVVLLVIVLIIFGPGRLPELGSGLGKAMREFRKATTELTNEVRATVDSTKPEADVKVDTPSGSEPKAPSSSN
ncbi:MAG TPA: twin-arginine translocase TatA/TatE family subunit [Candidatus Polarisedimenticolia bacterium]|jgi:sec-independent protein translocase protein TatA|nr:twin-arginine translocase TatA/TatE family subunit [Candidatus Polarisedimenticolia bacterium]